MEATGNDLKQTLQTTQADVNADLAAIEAQAKLETANVEASASIQASLDSTSMPSIYSPPAIDMTGGAAGIEPFPLQDPIALTMELDSLNEQFSALQERMNDMRSTLSQLSVTAKAVASPNAQGHLL
jgi:hypothetical protein